MLSALAATVLAVITLCGTAVFGASLSHLTATPELYGDPFQIDFGPGPPQPALLSSLIRNPAIARISLYAGGGEISVNKVLVGSVPATPVRGQLLFSAVAGHLPSGDSQIGLGAATMRQVGAHVGSVVTVSLPTAGKQRAVPFRVTAQVSFPVIAGGIVSLGTGALITIAGLEHARCPRGPGRRHACRSSREKATAGSSPAPCPVHAGRRPSAGISTHIVDRCPPGHPDIADQLRRGSRLPPHLRCGARRIRRGDTRPSPRGERLTPPTGNRAAEGARVRERSSGLRRGLASHDVGSCRDRRRHSGRGSDRSGDMEGIRQQSGRYPGIRRADTAPRRTGWRDPRRREPHRRGACAGSDSSKPGELLRTS